MKLKNIIFKLANSASVLFEPFFGISQAIANSIKYGNQFSGSTILIDPPLSPLQGRSVIHYAGPHLVDFCISFVGSAADR